MNQKSIRLTSLNTLRLELSQITLRSFTKRFMLPFVRTPHPRKLQSSHLRNTRGDILASCVINIMIFYLIVFFCCLFDCVDTTWRSLLIMRGSRSLLRGWMLWMLPRELMMKMMRMKMTSERVFEFWCLICFV